MRLGKQKGCGSIHGFAGSVSSCIVKRKRSAPGAAATAHSAAETDGGPQKTRTFHPCAMSSIAIGRPVVAPTAISGDFFTAEQSTDVREAMNQTAGATNTYRRCSKGGKVREKPFKV
ncbi:unnamed protein product [Boreogadus saida]